MTAFIILLAVILLILFFGYKRIPVISRYIGSAGFEIRRGWREGVDGTGGEEEAGAGGKVHAGLEAAEGKAKKAASAVKSKVKKGVKAVKGEIGKA